MRNRIWLIIILSDSAYTSAFPIILGREFRRCISADCMENVPFFSPFTCEGDIEYCRRLEYCPDCHLAQISSRIGAREHVLHCDGSLTLSRRLPKICPICLKICVRAGKNLKINNTFRRRFFFATRLFVSNTVF
jgi:hypothetical protein